MARKKTSLNQITPSTVKVKADARGTFVDINEAYPLLFDCTLEATFKISFIRHSALCNLVYLLAYLLTEPH